MTALVTPVTLTGQRWVSLEPLTRDHIAEIDVAAADGELATLWYTMTPKPGGARAWVERMLELRAADHGVSFVVRGLDGRLVGSSSYLHVDGANRRLEIGRTWYVADARGTGVNAETKLLMLGHAFDELNCVAVEFRTHFSTSPAARRSSAWAPSWTGCCAAIRSRPTAPAATPSSTRSSTSNGLRCGPT